MRKHSWNSILLQFRSRERERERESIEGKDFVNSKRVRKKERERKNVFGSNERTRIERSENESNIIFVPFSPSEYFPFSLNIFSLFLSLPPYSYMNFHWISASKISFSYPKKTSLFSHICYFWIWKIFREKEKKVSKRDGEESFKKRERKSWRKYHDQHSYFFWVSFFVHFVFFTLSYFSSFFLPFSLFLSLPFALFLSLPFSTHSLVLVFVRWHNAAVSGFASCIRREIFLLRLIPNLYSEREEEEERRKKRERKEVSFPFFTFSVFCTFASPFFHSFFFLFLLLSHNKMIIIVFVCVYPQTISLLFSSRLLFSFSSFLPFQDSFLEREKKGRRKRKKERLKN